jgi:hypothetical protein
VIHAREWPSSALRTLRAHEPTISCWSAHELLPTYVQFVPMPLNAQPEAAVHTPLVSAAAMSCLSSEHDREHTCGTRKAKHRAKNQKV